ncbi:MAG: ATP-dependent DNA ligase [Ilumatobacter sp.]|nr:MAG: ATP-dependent DNA ligase [Ilumatobacter sp.]
MSSPSFRPLMLATLVDEPVEGDDWIFERKLDGIRLLIVRDHDTLHLYTRNEVDHTERYPELHDALIHQRCDRYVVDGEVVAFDGARTSFARLQGRSGLSDPEQIVATGIAVKLYLFDMVHLDGEDRDELALRDRKALLRDAFDFDDPLRFCSHRNADGPAFLEQACRDGWEGLIAKRARSRYRSGRSRDWLKLKCTARQEFVIGGFTDPTGSRSRFGALLLGYRRDDALVYAGRVGTGFDQHTLEELGDELERRERPDSPFDDAPDDDVHWVRPDLVCEVGFTEWTNDGKLRHPRYLGLREDKSAEDVVREEPEASP